MTPHRSDSFGRNAALVAVVSLREATVEWLTRGDAWRLLMMAGALSGLLVPESER